MTAGKPEAVQRRLDLSGDSVDRAKRVFSQKSKGTVVEDLTKIEFRPMLDAAVDEFLPQITAALDQIRLHAPTDTEEVIKRPRPVSIETWERLGVVGEKYDLSRLQLIRCVLELMGASDGGEASGKPKKKRKASRSSTRSK